MAEWLAFLLPKRWAGVQSPGRLEILGIYLEITDKSAYQGFKLATSTKTGRTDTKHQCTICSSDHHTV